MKKIEILEEKKIKLNRSRIKSEIIYNAIAKYLIFNKKSIK